jgi:hypothetical protein
MQVDAPEMAVPLPGGPELFAVAAVAACGCGASLAVLWTIVRRLRSGLPAVDWRPHAEVPWAGGDVAGAVLVYLGFQVLAVGALPAQATLQWRLAVAAASMLAATAVTAAHLLARGATTTTLGFCGGRLRDDAALAVAGLALLVAPLLSLAALLDQIVPYEHAIVDFLGAHRDPLAVGIVVFAAVVAAPVAEEFLFRGVLQGWLERRLPQRDGLAAVSLSALAFAAAHVGQGLAWLPLFFFGLVVGYLARQTGSIVPGIILHALFNAVSVVLLLVQTAPTAGAAG